MKEVWISIAVVAVASFVMKAAGPVILGGRELPRPVVAVIALVVVETVSDNGHLSVDAQTAGVAVSGVAFVLRVPMLAAIALGAGTAALLRI